MRRGGPAFLDYLGCRAQLLIINQQTHKKHGGWHQVRRFGMSFLGAAQGAGAIKVFQGLATFFDQQGGAALACNISADCTTISRGFQRLLCAFPVSFQSLEVEHGLSCPTGIRAQGMGAPGIFAGAVVVTAPKGRHHQAAQPQKLGFGTFKHGFEMALGSLAVAIKLCGLCRQEQGERRMAKKVIGLGSMAARLSGITGGNRDKARGQSLVAFFAASLNNCLLHSTGSAPKPTDDPEDKKQCDRQHHNGKNQQRYRCCDLIGTPDHGNIAAHVDEPDNHGNRTRDQSKIEDKCDHGSVHRTTDQRDGAVVQIIQGLVDIKMRLGIRDPTRHCSGGFVGKTFQFLERRIEVPLVELRLGT